VRQRVRCGCHRLRADRQLAQHRDHPPVRADPGRRTPQPEPRLRAGAGDDRDHRPVEHGIPVAPVTRRVLGSWLMLLISALYFLVPLLGTFEFSLRYRRGVYSFEAYRIVLTDPRFHATFLYSTVLALATIVFGILLVVPTAYWIQLRLPKLRPVVEFVTLLPLVIPAIVLVFGYLRIYNSSSFLPMTSNERATDVL